MYEGFISCTCGHIFFCRSELSTVSCSVCGEIHTLEPVKEASEPTLEVL